MSKLIIPAIAIALAFSATAFTPKRSTSNFYKYVSTSHAQADIQNISNYQAETESCPSGSNVCGVTLTTAKNDGQTPVTSEFNAESSNLWSSQQNGLAADGNISMKN